jgi:hypothetical protein
MRAGNASAIGDEKKVRRFLAPAEVVGLQWLTGKAEGCCKAELGSAEQAAAALAKSGADAGGKTVCCGS